MEMLSEHQCEGWLEGYLLTGRHGLFNCYEAFIHIVDSMFNQHAKWLKVTRAAAVAAADRLAELPARVATSGGRITTASRIRIPASSTMRVNKKAEIVRVYLPPDANCLLVGDGSLPAQPALRQRRRRGQASGAAVADMDAAVQHCAAGIGIWEWASNDEGAEPDVVMACGGDVPTLETLAAVSILREHLPALKIRVVNVVDLMKLQPPTRASARVDATSISTSCSPETSR